jgi:two-component system cell cycle response regulator DivK
VVSVQSSATNAGVLLWEGLRTPDEALVLIVDDYQDCREMYAAYLTLAGYRVLKAADGPEAIAAARRGLPDLILMDLGLPGIDGCETTRRLKQDPATRGIPVVALTAQCLSQEESLAAAGFESVITKPCRPDDLAARVAATIRRTPR